MLKDKFILIGVTGGIACYKIAYLVSSLKKLNATVQVIMTKNATKFISPLTFETLSQNKCIVDMFEEKATYDVEHISVAKKADVFLIAPATANTIAKLANGLADDFLTTTFLATKAKKIIAPAMNTNMYENDITQHNIKKLQNYNINVIKPATGLLACRDSGIGKMPEPDILLEHILKEIAFKKDLKNKNILITAGATREFIDPVRFISNPSSGKMGLSLARACMLRGANVTLVCAKIAAPPPLFVDTINVVSAKDMFLKIKEIYKNFDIIFKTAAVSDFAPKNAFEQKVKKSSIDFDNIQLDKTTDILKFLGENKLENQILCGFSMETENLIQNSTKKLIDKNLDFIVCNDLTKAGAGFEEDTNIATIISKTKTKSFDKMPKFDLANKILDFIKYYS